MKTKRKLRMNNFTKCHPSIKKSRCLPNRFYSMSKAMCKKGEDHCILDNLPIDENEKKELRKQYLRPRRPKAWDSDPDAWLDNYNIAAVMKQYEEAYKWFRFLGVFPIDFSAPDPYKKDGKCLNREICDLNLMNEYNKDGQPRCLYKETCNIKLKDEYTKGIRGIGMIFNLDPHFKGGSHWVGLYINIKNIKKPHISYFDSYGYDTPPLIARFMKSFNIEINTCELAFNARKFQYGGSECGMFSMYFIICMISGISFKDFCKDSVNDKFMLDLRKILFSK